MRVTIETISQEVIRGQLVSLTQGEGALVAHGEQATQRIAFSELVRLRTDARPLPHPQGDYTVKLAHGDVLHGDVVGGAAEAIIVETPDVGRIRVAIENVKEMVRTSAARSAHRKAVEWFTDADDSGDDAVLLRNSDVLRGFVASVDAIGIALESELGANLVPHRMVVGVRFASPVAPPLDVTYSLATLRSGCRLTLDRLNWTGGGVEAQYGQDQKLRWDAGQIVMIEFVGGRWEWLSAHKPISHEHTPMMSVGWEYTSDRNVLGGPIMVGGERFAHGIGVHSRSRLVYDLQGDYTRFVTWFGIDDESGPLADASVAIKVDGQRRFAAEHVKRGLLHGPVRIDTAGAKRIELLVDYGDNGHMQDRFNWVEAALVR
ncbi:MAG: NPCBM/NEW2 domain-containing protein [Phycisphaerae bacterium]